MTINPSVDSQILSTLELLYYCRRFQNSVFAFLFKEHSHCEQLVMDLRVLQAAGIRQVIVCPDDDGLVSALETWNRAGDKFVVIEVAGAEIGSEALLSRLNSELSAGCSPFVALQDMPEDLVTRQALEGRIIECLASLGCSKVFFPAEEPGLVVLCGDAFANFPSHIKAVSSRKPNVDNGDIRTPLENQIRSFDSITGHANFIPIHFQQGPKTQLHIGIVFNNGNSQ